MKSYTDLQQSKKLAKILPLESADMYYSDVPVREWIDKTDTSKGTHVVFKSQIFAIENLRNHEIGESDIYAWSLAALLDVLPTYIKHYNYDTRTYKNYHLNLYKAYYCNVSYTFGPSTNENDDTLYCFGRDNFVDACVAMIEKLHEQNLL